MKKSLSGTLTCRPRPSKPPAPQSPAGSGSGCTTASYLRRGSEQGGGVSGAGRRGRRELCGKRSAPCSYMATRVPPTGRVAWWGGACGAAWGLGSGAGLAGVLVAGRCAQLVLAVSGSNCEAAHLPLLGPRPAVPCRALPNERPRLLDRRCRICTVIRRSLAVAHFAVGARRSGAATSGSAGAAAGGWSGPPRLSITQIARWPAGKTARATCSTAWPTAGAPPPPPPFAVAAPAARPASAPRMRCQPGLHPVRPLTPTPLNNQPARSLGDGMSEDDLLGGGTREPLRSCCVKLAGRLWSAAQHAPDFQDGLKELQVCSRVGVVG